MAMPAQPTHPNDPDPAQLAGDVLADATRDLALQTSDMPQAVRDSSSDYGQAIRDVLAATQQLNDDLGELEGQRDLLPAEGLRRLRREAVDEAQRGYMDAIRRAERSYEAVKDALTDAALPKVNAERESLAREELAVALSGQGSMVQKISDLAATGSREAVAALLSPYGRTLLKSKGLAGTDLDEALGIARTQAAYHAPATALEASEILAGMALAKLPRLGAAIGASSSVALRALRKGGARQW